MNGRYLYQMNASHKLCSKIHIEWNGNNNLCLIQQKKKTNYSHSCIFYPNLHVQKTMNQ